jgi:broad specificity phosphatase PhoE
LVRRLTSVVIDMEQQVIPTLVVSHVSILQCLMAYFRNTPVERCTSIEVPMHTVVKFTPVRGGGWCETHHPLFETNEALERFIIDESESEFSITTVDDDMPIWQDGLTLQRSELLHMPMRKAARG